MADRRRDRRSGRPTHPSDTGAPTQLRCRSKYRDDIGLVVAVRSDSVANAPALGDGDGIAAGMRDADFAIVDRLPRWWDRELAAANLYLARVENKDADPAGVFAAAHLVLEARRAIAMQRQHSATDKSPSDMVHLRGLYGDTVVALEAAHFFWVGCFGRKRLRVFVEEVAEDVVDATHRNGSRAKASRAGCIAVGDAPHNRKTCRRRE